MNTLKMVSEIKLTCSALETEKAELVARVKEIDDRITAYRMAIDSLELTLKPEEPAPVAETPVVPLPVKARKDTKMLTYNGKTQSINQWAEELGMTVGGIRYRLRNGWSIRDTLSQRPNAGKSAGGKTRSKAAQRVFKYDALGNSIRQYMSLSDAAKELHMSEVTVRKIIEHVSKTDQLKSHDYYLAYAK